MCNSKESSYNLREHHEKVQLASEKEFVMSNGIGDVKFK